MRTETILKTYNTLVLLTFLYGSENWTLTALQRRRIEAVETKLLRPLTGYTLYGHKRNDYISRELQITGILDEYRRNWLLHLQRVPQSPWNYTTRDHKEGEKLEDRRNVGERLCKSGYGTDQKVQSLMIMMMMNCQEISLMFWNLEFHFRDRHMSFFEADLLALWPPLWSSGQSLWLQIHRSRVRFPALPDFLISSGSGTGSIQPREINWGATWIKSSGSGPENRD